MKMPRYLLMRLVDRLVEEAPATHIPQQLGSKTVERQKVLHVQRISSRGLCGYLGISLLPKSRLRRHGQGHVTILK